MNQKREVLYTCRLEENKWNVTDKKGNKLLTMPETFKQLSLGVLMDYLKNYEMAKRYSHDFLAHFIAERIIVDFEFDITREAIESFLDSIDS